MGLKEIESDLNLLKQQLGEHGTKADEILNHVKNLPTDQLEEYSGAFQTGLPFITQGVIDAIAGGKNPFAVSIASLSIFSGFLTIAGPMTGPVGPLISALTGLLQAILGQFLPVGPSLKDEITEVFDQFLADKLLDDLGAAADEIRTFVNTLERDGLRGKRSGWNPIDLRTGPEIRAIDKAWQWLVKEEKQSLPQWPTVLEKTCRVFAEMLRAVTLSIAYPSTRANAQPGEMLQWLPERLNLFLEYLRRITPVARQRGTFWMVGADHIGPNSQDSRKIGAVYTCDSIIKEPKWQKLYGMSQVMRVTLNEGQKNQPRPVVTLLTLDSHGTAYGVKSEWPPPYAPWPHLKSNDPRHPLEKCFDIHAVSADKLHPGGIFIYTANGNEIRGYVQNPDGKVFYDWPHAVTGDRSARSIRCVTQPKGFKDDPDENPKGNPVALKGVAWVWYAGCWVHNDRRNTDILVKFSDAAGVYIPAPWRDLTGIAVDQGYLWVYRWDRIACATHTSIRKALKENRAPSWMGYQGFPKTVLTVLEEVPEHMPGRPFDLDGVLVDLSGLVDLSPCDDGTLLGTFNEGIWTIGIKGNNFKHFMLTPRIDRHNRTLSFQEADFFRIPGQGFAAQKQSLFCWPLLEETTATLEEQTAVPTQSLRATSTLEDVAARVKQKTASALS